MGAKRGAVFAVMVQFLLRAGVIAVQTGGRPGLTHGTGTGSKTLVQFRGTKLRRSQKFVTVQNFDYVQMRVSGCPEHDKLSRKQKTPQKP
jgi:hypothetical protein